MSTGQIPLALDPPRQPRFSNFLAGPNAMTVQTLQFGLEPGQWYFVKGSSGSGRTHLALATVDALGAHARYLPLGDPRSAGLLDVTRAPWIVLDDVDALSGDRVAEQRLFNALNRWHADQTCVVMTGTRRRVFALPDLNSRIDRAVRLHLKPLNERQLGALIELLARDYRVPLGRGAVAYLLRRGPRNPGELSGLMRSLSARALAQRRAISVPLVGELVGQDL